jgi:ATP phosphoribosyltransferase regulatory subunit
MIPSGLLPIGFRDRLPPHADAAAAAVGRMLDAAFAQGYERVAPPLAEFADGLTGRLKASRAQDLMRVTDPVSQRTLALRPDLTGQVGRIAATRMAHHPRPLRLSYAGQVVKLRASQLRPERELLQVGCELIGLDSVAAAREVVAVAIEALEAAGVRGLTIDFTLPDLVDTLAAGLLPLPADEIEAVRARLDAKDAGGLDGAGAAYLPLIEAAGPFSSAIELLRAFDTGGALASRLDGLEAIAASIGDRATLTLDPTERHGFEYQSWLGFSIFADGVSGEIGRGGSYTIMHDSAEEPAIGFSLYIDPLVDAGLAPAPRRRLFIPLGGDASAAERLRAEGWVTVAALEDGDTPESQLCTHVLTDGEPRPIA